MKVLQKKLTVLLVALFVSTSFTSFSITPKKGRWILSLELQANAIAPVECIVNNQQELIIKNATEEIKLIAKGTFGDTCIYDFPDFFAELRLVWKKKSVQGYFWNKNKKGFYTIPLTGKRSKEELFNSFQSADKPITIAHKYEVQFSTTDENPEPAIGLFEQNGNELSGTFLTETGDYRFLAGNVFGNQLFLSCFDGSHAFLFKGEINDGVIKGDFYSSKTYHTDWIGKENPDYELGNPFELTYAVDSDAFTFEFEDLSGNTFNYPKNAQKNPVTIIQIMGTWCPNCMDETRYYLDLYKRYHEKGLEIILVAFEYGDDKEVNKKRLTTFRDKHNIPFTMLYGGTNSKAFTSQQFPQLNGIISYPTSIFLDADGKILKTHTGFSGPGTGEYFEKYKADMELFLREALQLN
ncbi:MAG: TlpA family protein disulfide reductase [Crocinitomicaceae bacterium]|jgi:thiol-disulfide isomerase/thioredoxin|nr:TlpA family protein disulfide reductase [Crocinitomicaceae bacterium]